jgi:hypothetical protein
VLVELSKEITGKRIFGLFAVFFCFFCNAEIIAAVFSGEWTVIYPPLVFFALLFFMRQKYFLSSLIMLFAGLLRPESWLYSAFFLIWMKSQKKHLKPLYFISLLAPFLWALFDWRLSGDWFYSYHATARHAAVSGFPVTTFFNFWPAVARNTFLLYNRVILSCGIIFVLMDLLRSYKKQGEKHGNLMMVMVILPFLFYWALSLKGSIVVYPRFFAFSYAVIYFCAVLLPWLIFKERKILTIFFLVLLALVSFSRDNLGFAVTKRIYDDKIDKTSRELGDFLQGYLANHKVTGRVLAGNNAWYFSLRLGEEFSQKIIMFREAGTYPELLKEIPPGLAVYQKWGEAGAGEKFDFLRRPRKFVVKNKYIFNPLFVTGDKCGIVYEVFLKAADNKLASQ